MKAYLSVLYMFPLFVKHCTFCFLLCYILFIFIFIVQNISLLRNHRRLTYLSERSSPNNELHCSCISHTVLTFMNIWLLNSCVCVIKNLRIIIVLVCYYFF